MKSKIAVQVIFVSISLVLSSMDINNADDEDLRVKRIKEQLAKFYKDYSQEKVYLHLDKNEYTVGQDLWYKAYLLNGTTHLPESKSLNLYIELANSDRQIINLQRLKINDGFAKGDFPLKDTIPEGYYHIRAYTSWMTNFDSELIPSYTIFISNPKSENFISKEQLRYNKRQNKVYEKAEEKVDIQFFPEGGTFINGLDNTVGFKAINGLGLGIDVRGSVFDNNNAKILEFQSNYKGIGRFSLVPDKDEKYYVLLEGYKKKYNLPEQQERGSLMKIGQTESSIDVEILSNKTLSADRNANEVILLAHSRGDVKFTKIVSLEKAPTKIQIPKHILPSGVVHVTMFNGRALPIAERLVFINQKNEIKYRIEMNMSESFYNKATFDIYATNNDGNPVETNFSAAVTPNFNKESKKNLSSNIITTILLSSDIRGTIEEPGYYFSNAPNASEALDNLLITQGWRRFSWEKLMADEFPEIINQRETGISVAGRITREFFSIPYANSKVELTVLNRYNDIYTTYSDDKGYFQFDNLNYPDTINIEIYAYKPNGRRNLLIELEEGTLPNVELNKENYTRYAVGKGKYKYQLDNNKKYKSPAELQEEKFKEAGHHKIHGEPDYVITSDQIPSGYNNIFQVLNGRVPGLAVNGNSVVIRGPNSLLMSNEPLYIIDGVPSDANGAGVISPQDVDRIEILSGPSSAIYGSRGANGVIAIYTKRGRFMKKGFLDFEMLGYYSAREFYKPKYTSFTTFEEFKSFSPTIFWNPFMKTNENGAAKLSFDIPEFEFPMKIRIEGVSVDGDPAVGEKTIILK